MDLNQLRENIDDIDKQILSLFKQRMKLCKDVADYKKLHSMPALQEGREMQVIDRIKKLTADSSLENGTAALFTTIMDISKLLQNRTLLAETTANNYSFPNFEIANKIGCQGTSGSNSEIASRLIFNDKKLTFCKTFEDVFRGVQSGELDYGVIPIINSTAGSVDSTYDLMAKYCVYIVKEVCVEINHCLAVKGNLSISEISKVYSHPQAIAQCGDFLSSKKLKTSEYGNTATAAEKVANSDSDEKIAAICSVECAEKLGLNIIATEISDSLVNRTRFVCISRKMQVSSESNTISVMLKIPHTEGSLYRLLTKFFVNGMNLLRIESRPIKDGSFDVMFYLDFSGKITEPSVENMLKDLEQNLEYFRILGTFRN